MAEIAAFNRALNQAEYALVENYLSAKYDIPIGYDLYGGDTPVSGDFDLDVAGIGREMNGSNTVARSLGMIVRDNSFLQDSGDYLVFGHRTAVNATTSADLPASGEWSSAPSPARWERHWYIQVTDALGSSSGEVDIAFDLGEAGFPGHAPAIAGNYRLLKRSDSSGQFLDIVTASSVSGDQVVFQNVSVADLGSNFTLASLDNIQSPLGPAPTAIELASLAASRTPSGTVQVEWETATEFDNVGFDVYRASEPSGIRTRLNEVLVPTQYPGMPTGAKYTWLDANVVPDRIYFYWLEDIDVNGAATQHGPVSVTLPPLEQQYTAFLPIVLK